MAGSPRGLNSHAQIQIVTSTARCSCMRHGKVPDLRANGINWFDEQRRRVPCGFRGLDLTAFLTCRCVMGNTLASNLFDAWIFLPTVLPKCTAYLGSSGGVSSSRSFVSGQRWLGLTDDSRLRLRRHVTQSSDPGRPLEFYRNGQWHMQDTARQGSVEPYTHRHGSARLKPAPQWRGWVWIQVSAACD